jgi:hypothetical protein
MTILGKVNKKDFISSVIDQVLRSYEREYKKMDLYVIDEIVDLIAYIERSLSQRGANMLLAGRAGCGRK